MHFPTWIDLKGQDSVPDTVHHTVIIWHFPPKTIQPLEVAQIASFYWESQLSNLDSGPKNAFRTKILTPFKSSAFYNTIGIFAENDKMAFVDKMAFSERVCK